jgi:hypothetical protein
MDDTLIYAKTPKGVNEVATRAGSLGLSARRVLIMIDGKRTVADLAVLLRAGEVESTIAMLEAQGFIRSTGDQTPPTLRDDLLRESLDVNTVEPAVEPLPVEPTDRAVMTLEEAKRRAVRELTDRMGPDGEIMAVRLEQAKTADELRDRLREAERLIGGLMGEAAAQDYLRALRKR